MTKALYFDNAFLKSFEAVLDARRRDEAGTWLRLNRTAFYPEGGGQPGDSGWLMFAGDHKVRVLDTHKDATGDIWHKVEGREEDFSPGSALSGELDWERRFDHMQQHTGEHIIAASLHELTGGFTHGLHIGKEFSTIDVSLPDGATKLELDILERIEALANARIAEDAPIRCYFPREDELKSLPLRKDPTVSEHVRVCLIGEYEGVACGGTHLDSAGRVGLTKLLKSEPARGKMRLSFLCGKRAMAHYALCYKAVSQAGSLLSAREEDLVHRLEETLKHSENTRRELAALRRRDSLSKAPHLLEKALVLADGRRVVLGELEETDLPAMEALAGLLVREDRVIALLCAKKEGMDNLLFACSANINLDMPELLRSTGAKGGGRPDFARGASRDSLPWEAAKVMAPHL